MTDKLKPCPKCTISDIDPRFGLDVLHDSLEKIYSTYSPANRNYLNREHSIYLYGKLIAYERILKLAVVLKTNKEKNI